MEREFFSQIEDLLGTAQVQQMKFHLHHRRTPCFEHCLFVSYLMFKAAKQMNLDPRQSARVGLLHDMYLYDSDDPSAHPGRQVFDHPEFAVMNAMVVTDLTELEENAIYSHMWPITKHWPKSKIAWLLIFIDKYCALEEVFGRWHNMRLRTDLVTEEKQYAYPTYANLDYSDVFR